MQGHFGTVLAVDDLEWDEKPVMTKKIPVRGKSNSPVRSMSRKEVKNYISKLESLKEDINKKIREFTAELSPENDKILDSRSDQKKEKNKSR